MSSSSAARPSSQSLIFKSMQSSITSSTPGSASNCPPLSLSKPQISLVVVLLQALLLLSPASCKHIDHSLVRLASSANSSLETSALLGEPTISFARVYRLPDGEIVTKLKWNNFTAIETRYSDIDLIQIIKEFQVIQLWLSNGDLVDCEYTNEPHKVASIQHQFGKVNPNIHKDSKSFTMLEEHHNLTAVPQHLQRLTEYEQFVHKCADLHKAIKSKYMKDDSKKKRGSRGRRDLLVFPGTKWCGRGSNSQNFEDLGEYTFADRCCRDHDRCKYSIGPFDTRYHLLNMRFHFVSHCSCDERFRSCLKVANSGAANLVGKIYFNVVETKCFMFQMEEVCNERSWWGSCLSSKRRKRAVFREPMTY